MTETPTRTVGASGVSVVDVRAVAAPRRDATVARCHLFAGEVLPLRCRNAGSAVSPVATDPCSPCLPGYSTEGRVDSGRELAADASQQC